MCFDGVGGGQRVCMSKDFVKFIQWAVNQTHIFWNTNQNSIHIFTCPHTKYFKVTSVKLYTQHKMHTAWVNSLKSFGNFIHPYNQSHSEDIEHFYQLFFASCHFAVTSTPFLAPGNQRSVEPHLQLRPKWEISESIGSWNVSPELSIESLISCLL